MRGMCKALALFAVLTLALVSPSRAGEVSAAAGSKDSLVGTWRLVSYEDLDASGKVTREFGEHPLGYVVYDSTGHVFVNIMKTPPLPAAGFEDEKPTPGLKSKAYEAYVGYFGTYSVDWQKSEVVHHVEGSLDPSYTGTDQPRPFLLQGDTLILGDQKTWKRLLVRVSPRNP